MDSQFSDFCRLYIRIFGSKSNKNVEQRHRQTDIRQTDRQTDGRTEREKHTKYIQKLNTHIAG